ncbi:hypothetical protein [Streptomyces hirsutus]|uniref:hypothetical protein n=1 Tax=Streptomyces hirsutus TaxID=35620 RepID=UPI0036AB7B32
MCDRLSVQPRLSSIEVSGRPGSMIVQGTHAVALVLGIDTATAQVESVEVVEVMPELVPRDGS